MDFEFSEEQVAIRDTIRELVQDRVAPRAAEIDEKGEYPKDIEKLFAQNGILGIPFPEQYGGISGSSVSKNFFCPSSSAFHSSGLTESSSPSCESWI